MAQLNTTQVNGNLTVTGKASLASTADTTPTSNYDLTSKKYVDDQISELNSKFVGNWHVEYAQVNLSYSNSTTMTGYNYFSNTVLAAVATLENHPSTPTNQTERIVVDCNYGQGGRVQIYVEGAGFIDGHVMLVNVIAIVRD